jgi:hypothetical protein
MNTKHAIREVLALGKSSRDVPPWSIHTRPSLSSIAKRWPDVPTSGGAALIYNKLREAIENPENVRAKLADLSADDRALIAAFARFGGGSIAIELGIAPLVEAGRIAIGNRQYLKEPVFGRLGEAPNTLGLIAAAPDSGYFSRTYRAFVTFPNPPEYLQHEWQPLSFPTVEEPDDIALGTPPAALSAAIVAAAIVIRETPKPVRKDGLLSAPAFKAAVGAMGPLAETIDAVGTQYFDWRTEDILVNAAATIGLLRSESGQLLDWPVALSALFAGEVEPQRAVASLWGFLHRSAVAMATPDAQYHLRSVIDGLFPLVTEACLRLALGQSGWCDAIALRNWFVGVTSATVRATASSQPYGFRPFRRKSFDVERRRCRNAGGFR